MSTVQFEPKITADFQIDWRRNASRGADPFADLLKQHLEADRQAARMRRHADAADPLSGRPPRIVITHPKTLRGEAKEVDDRQLPDRMDHAAGEVCAQADEAAAPEPDAADAELPAQDETTEVATETEAAAPTEQATAANAPADASDAAAPIVALIVVPAQATDEQAAATGEPELAVAPPASLPADADILPEQMEQAATTPSDGAQPDPDADAGQQAVAAIAEAALTDAVMALATGQSARANGAQAAPPGSQPATLAPAPAKTEQPLLQLVQTPVPPAERPAIDLKPRQAASARANPASPAPTPNPAAAPQATQPHQPALLQPAAGEFGGTAGLLEQGLSEDGFSQGWALHLAQGAATKRADFVAQLRQHLQNLPAHEQVAVHIQRAVREGTGRLSIQLSPAELGSIHVKLEIDEEKRVTAAVTVERPSTLELLQRDIKGLERALHNAGLNMEGGDLSFSLGRGSDQEFAQDLGHAAASAAGVLGPDSDSDGDQPASPVAQVMDTAAGIVNLQV